jgi:hypothetical protein
MLRGDGCLNLVSHTPATQRLVFFGPLFVKKWLLRQSGNKYGKHEKQHNIRTVRIHAMNHIHERVYTCSCIIPNQTMHIPYGTHCMRSSNQSTDFATNRWGGVPNLIASIGMPEAIHNKQSERIRIAADLNELRPIMLRAMFV